MHLHLHLHLNATATHLHLYLKALLEKIAFAFAFAFELSETFAFAFKCVGMHLFTHVCCIHAALQAESPAAPDTALSAKTVQVFEKTNGEEIRLSGHICQLPGRSHVIGAQTPRNSPAA